MTFIIILNALAAVFSFITVILLTILLIKTIQIHGDTKSGSTVASEVNLTQQQVSDGEYYHELNEDIVILSRILVHDLNNKLGAIVGTVSVIKYQMKNNIPVSSNNLREDLGAIKDAVDKASSFIRKFQQFYKGGTSIGNVINIKHLLREIISWCNKNNNKKIKFNLNQTQHPVMITANPWYIQNILKKVCLNSSDASEKGSSIDISVDVIPTSKEYEFKYNYREMDKLCRIEIKDNGCGISNDEKDLLFKIFETTNENSSGIGLVIVKEILKWHNGFLEIESQEGEGTTVSLFIPEHNGRE